jgi:hypothetical protein
MAIVRTKIGPENAGRMFLPTFGFHLQGYMTSQPKRPQSELRTLLKKFCKFSIEHIPIKQCNNYSGADSMEVVQKEIRHFLTSNTMKYQPCSVI